MAIVFFVFMAKAFLRPRPNPTLRTTELMTALPFILAALAIMLHRTWNRFFESCSFAINSRFVNGEKALVLALAIVPFGVLTVLSLSKPTFNARGMLLLGPYLLLVLASGIVRASRNRVAAIALLFIISVAHYEGAKQYDRMSAGRADYEALAMALVPHIKKADLIFVRPSWYSTPVFYYLNAGWDRFVGQDYKNACQQNPRARVWTLVFYNYEESVSKPVEDALSNYTVLQTIEAPGARAVLYSPQFR